MSYHNIKNDFEAIGATVQIDEIGIESGRRGDDVKLDTSILGGEVGAGRPIFTENLLSEHTFERETRMKKSDDKFEKAERKVKDGKVMTTGVAAEISDEGAASKDMGVKAMRTKMLILGMICMKPGPILYYLDISMVLVCNYCGDIIMILVWYWYVITMVLLS